MTPWTVATRLLCPWGFSRQEYWSGLPYPPPGDIPKPGIEPRSPPLRVDFLPSETPGEPKKTGVGSWSLLQGNFLTQKSNQGLLHCWWILYQLNHPGSPLIERRQAQMKKTEDRIINDILLRTIRKFWSILQRWGRRTVSLLFYRKLNQGPYQ